MEVLEQLNTKKKKKKTWVNPIKMSRSSLSDFYIFFT